MTKQEITERIDSIEGEIATEREIFENRTKNLRTQREELIKTYATLYAPLSVGDEIEYSPAAGVPPGIVRIESAECTQFPDQWRYVVRILSVGDYPDKRTIGRTLRVYFGLTDTPKKIN